MAKFLREVSEEKRKIRWSTPKKATMVFISTIVIIVIMVLVISLFSWVIALMLP